MPGYDFYTHSQPLSHWYPLSVTCGSLMTSATTVRIPFPEPGHIIWFNCDIIFTTPVAYISYQGKFRENKQLGIRSLPIVLYVNEYHSLMPSDEKTVPRCEQCGIYFDSLEEFTRHDKEKHLE